MTDARCRYLFLCNKFIVDDVIAGVREDVREAARLFHKSGWRASDRDELAEEYRLTPIELDALVKALEDIEGDGE